MSHHESYEDEWRQGSCRGLGLGPCPDPWSTVDPGMDHGYTTLGTPLHVPVLALPGHATLGTPVPPPQLHVGTGSCSVLSKSVLWAPIRHCVTLKSTLKSISERLSGLWLPFKAHVARTKLIQRPQGAYVYPIHLSVYQEWVHYPNEN